MTRISKRIIGWLLGALATLAVAFGIYFAMPQSTKSVKAETGVSFVSASLDKEVHATYGTSIRFNTGAGGWGTSTYPSGTWNNWVSASSYPGISDYTKVNGRTVTEINAANPGKQPITLMTQPLSEDTGFLRLFIPADIMSVDEVYSMEIMDGWNFVNTSNSTTYTAPAATFVRQGSSMVLASTLTDATTHMPVIGSATLANVDCLEVNITAGDASALSYEVMGNSNSALSVRNLIYINGKSIEQWNNELLAEDEAFYTDRTMYRCWPQNSAESGHEKFHRPIAVYGTATGFTLHIFREVFADCDTITVTVGSGLYYNQGAQWLVGNTVSANVWTQTADDVTDSIGLFSNTIDTSANYAIYYIDAGTAGNWTTAARAGGCLNESDPVGAGGGQNLLRHIYFNGSSVYDINKASDESFGSTQGNIVNGGYYAPIFANLNSYNGGSILLYIPLRFAGLDENGATIDGGEGSAVQGNHREIVLKKGLAIYDPTTGVSSYLVNDVVFTNTTGGAAGNTRWTKSITPEIEGTTTVSAVTNAYHAGGFLTFTLSNNDYPKAVSMVILDSAQKARVESGNLYDMIEVAGTSIRTTGVGENILSLGGSKDTQGSLSLRINAIQGNYTTNDVTDWAAWAAAMVAAGKEPTVVIKAGAEFPTYDYIINGGTYTCYVTTEDITYVYDETSGNFIEAGAYVPTEEDFTKGVFTVGTETGSITPTSGVSYVNAADVSGMPAGTSDVVLKMSVSSGHAFISVDFSASQILAANVESVVVKIWTPTANTSSSQFRTGSTSTGTWTSGYDSYYSTTADMTSSWCDVTLMPQVITDMTDANGYLTSTILGVRAKSGETEFYIDSITVNMKATAATVDITDGWIFSHVTVNDGTEQYTLFADGTFWTKAPLGGCLNEYDYDTEGGGQIQMKYIYFNGTSLHDINVNDDGAYDATQANIVSGGRYAPILVLMGTDAGTANKSFVQLRVPTNYAGGEHNTITIKEGFSVTEENTTWVVNEDITFYNHGNGVWSTEVPLTAGDVSFSVQEKTGDVYKIAIELNGITFDTTDANGENPDSFYFNYFATARIPVRQNLYLNGVSLYDINTTVDDSAYVYDTFPMTNINQQNGYDVFANPTLLYTENGTNVLIIWIFEDYLDALFANGDVTVTVGNGFSYGGKTLIENVEYTWAAPEVPVEPEETTENTAVTGILTKANRTDGGNNENFIIIQIGTNDYSGLNTKAVAETPNKDLSGLVGKIEILTADDETVTVNSISGEMFFNVWGEENSVAFRWSDAATLAGVQSITIKAGAKFPSATTENKYYVTTEDVTIYQVAADTWVKEENLVEAVDLSVSSITKVDDVYKVFVELPGITFTNTSNDTYDLNYNSADRIAVRQHIFIDGKSLPTIAAEDDSKYTYGTFPMNHSNADTFGHPAILAAEVGTSTLQIWIFEGYVEDIKENGITLTLGSGFTYGEKTVIGDFNYSLTADVTVTTDNNTYECSNVMKGTSLSALLAEKNIPTPSKPSTEKYVYTFDNWYISGTGDVCTTITDDMVIEARFTEKEVPGVTKTEIVSIQYSTLQNTGAQDNWLVITLSENDYDCDALTDLTAGGMSGSAVFTYLQSIGFLQGITLYGTIYMPNSDDPVTQTTLEDFYKQYSSVVNSDRAYFNIWNKSQFDDTIAIRVGNTDKGDSEITKIVVAEGTGFPSYRYISAADADKEDNDYRYVLGRTMQFDFTHQNDDGRCYYSNHEEVAFTPDMTAGASVRIKSNLDESGIRFQTIISKDIVAELEEKVALGWYDSVSYGTIIVPTDYLTGGQFTHAWLTANYGDSTLLGGNGFIDIVRSDWYRFDPDSKDNTFYGSIVKLMEANYSRKFSGRGYIKLTKGDVVTYIYADYNPAQGRTAAFIADAAINDRSNDYDEVYYPNLTENNNYSPYTAEERSLLGTYIKETVTSVSDGLVNLANTGMDRTGTLTTYGWPIKFNYVNIGADLEGARITLNYTTKTDVWGQFVYCSQSNASNSANWVYEEFYLPANSSQHRQYFDIYRTNGVGYGLAADDLHLVKIGFATTDDNGADENVKLISYVTRALSIDTSNSEIYLTKDIADDGYGNSFQMTVGAHLRLGGSFTYLAKSRIFEGVVTGTAGATGVSYNSGSVQLATDTSSYVATRKTKAFGGTTEAGYYGSATSSKAADGAVNLINNVDAGRQFQQSWYANVGGVKDKDGNVTGTDGSNGYLRGYCYTEGGSYWPYNPVQAGDVVSNPSQIVDYEITSDYIYVKCRAMDWGKGYDSSKSNHTNTVQGGVTTRSYIENYYRINDDGTVTITNSFIDWNGFTDMENIDYQSIELPAAYPIHTLHTYHSDTNGDGNLESFSNLGSWTDAGLAQTKNSAALDSSDGGYCTSSISPSVERDRIYGMKASDWFVWSNGGAGTVALGVYIPNVEQFLSGRTNGIHGSTSLSDSDTRDASSNKLFSKGLNSNMQANNLTYRSSYVTATSYTAPGVNNKMKEYVQIEYSYVVSVNTLTNVEKQFKALEKSGKIDNSGLDAWARADKIWIQ
ncbi:MAG: hypothetical protein E7380_04540 [Clostridiales bacterium]|nr:hypothetical protein [Clostridiales bacterium]